jgi:glutamine amidotransferase
MSAKKLIREFLAVRKEFPSSYAMFHARYATHGVKNEENCHPFRVPSNPDTYLAHNGILDIAIKAGDKRSDTRIFAEDTLPAMGGMVALDDDHVYKMLSKWAMGSKIAILTLDPAAKEQCYIINEDAGHWDNDGMWWSNSTYLQSTYASPTSWSSWVEYDKDRKPDVIDAHEIYECPTCQAVAIEDANPYYCEMCYTCWDCDGVYGDSCLCFTPSAQRYDYAKKSSQGKGWYYDKYFDFGK